MEVETKIVSISQIKLNPNNPRKISQEKLDSLIKSLVDFPEMLEVREIVVDETMTILGGNQRLLALKKTGAKKCMAKIVTHLSLEQKREFMIKDNASWGSWDFDVLGSLWKGDPLEEWGLSDQMDSISGSIKESLKQEETELQPYEKVHLLISIDIEAIDQVTGVLDQLRDIRGIEIEQSAN